jgi:uncharacterized damage-inducible protein DinB
MEVTDIKNFTEYYSKTRVITNKVLAAIPTNRLDWAYSTGKFTIGDIIRHIAAIERYVFAEIAIGNKPCYRGCGEEISKNYNNVFDFFNEMHAQSIQLFESLDNESLSKKVSSVDGNQIKLSSFLRALIVHEIHHRAVLCIYLNLLGIQTPPVIGLTETQVIELSK